MTVHVIYLKLEGYVRKWLIHHYGKKGQDPISFPKWSMENDVMQDNLQRKPKDWEPERKDGCIAIRVPKREGLNRDVWCYLPERILVILRKTIMRHFVKDFMKFIATPNPATSSPPTSTTTSAAWCSRKRRTSTPSATWASTV